MQYKLTITAQSPLAFPPRKPGTQFTQSLNYIPGSVLWGAVGQQLRRTPDASFTNALPARDGDKWVRVLPATAMSCKAHPGFIKKEKEEKEDKKKKEPPHGVFDTLIDRICSEALRPAAFTYNPQCPCCLQRAKGFGGVYTRNEAGWHKRSVQQRVLTRVAIDRQRSTSSESQLYSPIVISEVYKQEKDYHPTMFIGHVKNLDEEGRQALEQVTSIGARRSSGLGQVKIKIEEIEKKELSPREALATRLDQLNTLFTERWKLFNDHLCPQTEPDWLPSKWKVFTIGLQSPTFLLEDGWQPTIVFSAAQLKEQTGLEATLVRSQATYDTIGGWNTRWERPKPTMLAANSGSVYVFRTQATREALVDALYELETKGIGERRAEGYGNVYCCDEFHTLATKERV